MCYSEVKHLKTQLLLINDIWTSFFITWHPTSVLVEDLDKAYIIIQYFSEVLPLSSARKKNWVVNCSKIKHWIMLSFPSFQSPLQVPSRNIHTHLFPNSWLSEFCSPLKHLYEKRKYFAFTDHSWQAGICLLKNIGIIGCSKLACKR